MSTKEHTHKSPVTRIHKDHVEWLNEISLMEEEFEIMSNRLAEFDYVNEKGAAKALVEHFQNQFLIHGKHIIQLKKSITKQEKQIATALKKFPAFFDDALTDLYQYEKEKMSIQRKTFSSLRKEFMKFLSNQE